MKAKDIFIYSLAAIFILGSFVLFFILKETTTTTVQGIMEILKMGDVLILGYFFGSSKSSSDKTGMIHNSTPIKEP